jgi:hypothetical protein
MKKTEYTIPKFKTLEEEDTFWKTHSPLNEGFKGKIQKTKQKRSSFLSVRFTGEEISRLRELAIEYGLSISSLARLILVQHIGSKSSFLPAELVFSIQKHSVPNNWSDKEKEQYLSQLNCVFDEYLRMQKQMAIIMSTLSPKIGEDVGSITKHLHQVEINE